MGRSAGMILMAAMVLGAAAEALPDDCYLPKVVGRCRAAFPRWWFNASSQACQEFIYGGCRGNANNFVSADKCRQICAADGGQGGTEGEAAAPTSKAASRSGHLRLPGDDRKGFQEFCAAPPEVGRCRGAFPRWHFDLETRTCKMFIFGGCGGNKNNYDYEEHCLQCARDGELTEEPLEPRQHSHLFPDPMIHSTRAVVLAVLLALMAAALLGSMVLFLVKICRKNPQLSLGPVWSTLDDKEYLMSNAYTL
ncbi:kunitz-type protease inhibitor 2 [Podarcis muralis]|uniref:kunitz-type protease inhibitor 2 n=1 Tax=Podarcis muralis TaxID=64176 RepID=UPI00109F2D8C|nr:kunitz-type protease inhibitor 2 [Podarcis muralis]